MVRIGLMGCGTVAGYGHLPAIGATEELDLAAIFEPDAERCAEAAERFRPGAAYDDAEAFYGCGLDAVTVTSPLPCHYVNVTGAIRHGLPVLCEKPLAMHDMEAAEMISQAQAAGVALYTGFNYRFGEAEQCIKRLCGEGAIGEVRSLRLIYIWNCHGRYETDAAGNRIEQRRRQGRMLEGGPMVDCGTHQVDLARWWLGSEVADFDAWGAWVEAYEAPDHVWLHMDHENGAHTMVEISYSYAHTALEPEHHFIYDLIGTEGVIRYDRAKERVVLRSSAATENFSVRPGKNFAGLYAAFAKAVATGDDADLPTARDGQAAARITREATEAAMARRIAGAREP